MTQAVPQEVVAESIRKAFEPAARMEMLRRKTSLTEREAAELTGIPPSSLAKMRANGVGPAYVKTEKRVYYRPQDLDAYMIGNRCITAEQQ